MLSQLLLLAEADEPIVSVGPYNRRLFSRRRVLEVHNPLEIPSFAFWVHRLNLRTDLVHAWSLPAARAARGLHCRRVVLSLPCLPPPDKFETVAMHGQAGTITLPTLAAYETMKRNTPAGLSLAVLPPAANVGSRGRREATRARLKVTDEYRLLVAPADLVPGAGHKEAAWALAILMQLQSNWRLLIPGDGPTLERVRFFASGTGCGDQMLWGKDLSLGDCLEAADAAIFPAKHDVGLSAAARAMAAGVPIVASSTPDLSEILAEAAIFCEPGAPARTAAAILELFEQPFLAKTLGARARDRALLAHAPADIRARLNEIYSAPPAWPSGRLARDGQAAL